MTTPPPQGQMYLFDSSNTAATGWQLSADYLYRRHLHGWHSQFLAVEFLRHCGPAFYGAAIHDCRYLSTGEQPR